ncbi:caspase family protein [Sodalinema gerasimenkoae]|uniref:caspase family protein n=1 Tax=Sodalinema gerasimenkoae TaxID=2862348 RepID=UPI00135830EE|nr:caspase family protein [Sodalinema gerasimenkoae]
MKRRGFLEQSAWLLAATTATGFVFRDLPWQAAIADPLVKKRALLLGINRYPDATGSDLNGAVTDVALQKQVLRHRFGFRSEDILTLTDDQATRGQFLETFQGHFADLSSSDVVWLHFSGYGSQVQPSPESEAVEPSLVMADGLDLPLSSLWLLLRSLPTPKIITVLDTSYTYPGTPLLGNLRVRSRPSPTVAQLDNKHRQFQEQRRGNLKANLKRDTPGWVISAASLPQVATESQWQGFSCGLLTYALTQQLWWLSPEASLTNLLTRTEQLVETFAGAEQTPTICRSGLERCDLPAELPPPLVPQLAALGADGVILARESGNDPFKLWLGGLPVTVLNRYGSGSVFSVLPEPGTPPQGEVKLQVRSRSGLNAAAQLWGSPESQASEIAPGRLLRESVRILPRSLPLTVALDSRLERIERVDATSAFSGIRDVNSVLAGEQPADCVFGRVRRATIAQTYSTDLVQLPKDQGTYGLFSVGRELIPNSIGEDDEAIKKSVQRLVPQLQALLAAKWLTLTLNEGASRLGVRGTLSVLDSEQSVVLQRQTRRARRAKGVRPLTGVEGTLDIPAGSQVQYKLENLGDRPVYYLLFGLDSSGRAVGFYPYETVTDGNPPTLQQPPLNPGESIVLPWTEAETWSVGRPIGTVSMKLICCDRPFGQALTLLAARQNSPRNPRSLTPLETPLKVAQAILSDLHRASLRKTDPEAFPSDVYALDMDVWTTLNFVYRVV